MDPPLPLVTLRANNQMAEIRIQDLCFTQEETQQLIYNMLDGFVDQHEINEINAQAEGWVTGLRLSALAMHHRIGPNAVAGKLSAQNRYVTEYLFNEILVKQADTLSNCMLKTSILYRFCADLCEAICFPEEELSGNRSSQANFRGADFVEWLQASNFFVIPLDDQNEWFRYHHLFQEFLHRELIRRFTPDEIVELHTIAGQWCAQGNWTEEALHHFLAAEDTTAAIELIAQHRYKLMNEACWPILDNWLKLFDDDLIETSSELWMLKTWLLYQQGRWNELPSMIQQLDTLWKPHPGSEKTDRLAGEIQAVRSVFLFHTSDIEGSVFQARMALKQIPVEIVGRAKLNAFVFGFWITYVGR